MSSQKWTRADHERDVENGFRWLRRVHTPILSKIITTRQGQIVFNSLPALSAGLLDYATTQITRFEDVIKRLEWTDLLRLRYVPDAPRCDYWYDVKEILGRGEDDCEGLGMLLAVWLFLKHGIAAYPGIAYFDDGGPHLSVVVHCVTLIPDVVALPAVIRAACWTRYPMHYPIKLPAGWLVGDLSVLTGMQISRRYMHLVGAGPDGKGLPQGVVRTAAGLSSAKG